MKTFEVIGTAQPISPPSINSPPAVMEWTAVITMLAGGIGFIGRELVKQWNSKEQSESELMRGLIVNLQSVQGQLINDARESKSELIGHIGLKDSVSRMTALLKDDVGRAFASQGAMYAKGLENQALILSKLDALHSRLDDFEEQIQKLVQEQD